MDNILYFGDSLQNPKSIKISDYGLSYLPIMSAESLQKMSLTSIKARPTGTYLFMSPNMKKLYDNGEFIKA